MLQRFFPWHYWFVIPYSSELKLEIFFSFFFGCWVWVLQNFAFVVIKVLIFTLCLSADACEWSSPLLDPSRDVQTDLQPNSEPGNLTALKPQHSSSANRTLRRSMTSLSEEWTGITVLCGKWPVRPRRDSFSRGSGSQFVRVETGSESVSGDRVRVWVKGHFSHFSEKFSSFLRDQVKRGGCVTQ